MVLTYNPNNNNNNMVILNPIFINIRSLAISYIYILIKIRYFINIIIIIIRLGVKLVKDDKGVKSAKSLNLLGEGLTN
jgi:hypothetical protein